MAQNDNCYECGQTDTIVHSLTECSSTMNFLHAVLSHIDLSGRFIHEINLETFIFGARDQAWNTILLVIKSYIVYKRCIKQKLYVSSFLNYLYSHLAAEKLFIDNEKYKLKWHAFPVIKSEVENYIACHDL